MRTRTGSRSLEKGLGILDALAGSPKPLSVSELARSLKVARPTVYRLLASLLDHGYVTRDRARGRFRPSFKLLDIGHRLLQVTDLLDAARPVLRELQARSGETVHLAVPERGRMVYIDKLADDAAFCATSRLGKGVPMHCTALGKAVLAFLPVATVESIVAEHGQAPRTARTIVTWDGLEQELALVRRRGYALDDGEIEEGVRCVGAPILDVHNAPIAALSVSAPAARMPLTRVHDVGATVRDGAQTASRAFGWSEARRAR